MGKVIVVEPEQLKDAAEKINSYADSFEEIYNKLLGQAETMQGVWEGADNLAYVEQIKGLQTKLDGMVEKLRNASTTLTTQATNYSTQRDDNVTQVKSLTV